MCSKAVLVVHLLDIWRTSELHSTRLSAKVCQIDVGGMQFLVDKLPLALNVEREHSKRQTFEQLLTLVAELAKYVAPNAAQLLLRHGQRGFALEGRDG